MNYLALPGFAIAMAAAMPVTAAQTVHVHGEGRVDIAIEDDRVYLALTSPGADIVGFEHAPRSDEEKAAVEAATAKLGDPLQLLRFSPDADCRVLQATAGIDSDEHDDDEAEHAQHGHDAHEEDDHGDEEIHGAFVAEYEFQCSGIDALAEIEFTYFTHFDNVLSLDIVLIDDRGQRRAEIGRADPVLRLAP